MKLFTRKASSKQRGRSSSFHHPSSNDNEKQPKSSSTETKRICRTFQNKLASTTKDQLAAAQSASNNATLTTSTSTTTLATMISNVSSSTTVKQSSKEQASSEEEEENDPDGGDVPASCTVVIRVYTSDAPGATTSNTISTVDDDDDKEKEETGNYIEEEPGTIQSSRQDNANVNDDEDSLFDFDELLSTMAKFREDDPSTERLDLHRYAFADGETISDIGLSQSTCDTGVSYDTSLVTMEESMYSDDNSYTVYSVASLWDEDLYKKCGIGHVEHAADEALSHLSHHVSSYLQKRCPRSHRRLMAAWRELGDQEKKGIPKIIQAHLFPKQKRNYRHPARPKREDPKVNSCIPRKEVW